MNKIIPLTLLFAAFFVACKSRNIRANEHQSFYLSVERTPCFGTCPVYYMDVSQTNDGFQSTYDGKRFVQPLGMHTTFTVDSVVYGLISKCQTANWSSFKEEYRSGYTDLPSTLLRYSKEPGDTVSVLFESGIAPDELNAITAEMEQIRLKLYPNYLNKE